MFPIQFQLLIIRINSTAEVIKVFAEIFLPLMFKLVKVKTVVKLSIHRGSLKRKSAIRVDFKENLGIYQAEFNS